MAINNQPPPDEAADPQDQSGAPAPDAAPDQQQEPPPGQGSGGLLGDTGGDQPPPDDGAGQAQGQKASPEQQTQYNQFVNNGYHLIYAGGKTSPGILKSLASGPPVRALAMTATTVVMTLVDSAHSSNHDLDPAVILHGGKEIFQDLADLSSKAKIHTYNDADLGNAWVMAMDLTRVKMVAAGLVDPAAFQRDIQELNQAEKDGDLDKWAPGMGEAADAVKQAQAQAEPNGGDPDSEGAGDQDPADGPPAAPQQQSTDQGGGPDDGFVQQNSDQKPPPGRGLGG